MSILLDNNTHVIVQGITGREGQYHTRNMKAAGTNLLGGVTPGKGGETIEGLPVFDTVSEARAATGATASCIFVPGPFAADAIMEAASAGIELIVCISEWIPIVDMTRAMLVVREHGARGGHHLRQHGYGAGEGSGAAGSEGAGGRYHFRHSRSGKRGIGARIISIYEEFCLGGAQRVAPLYIGWSSLKALV